MAFPPPVPGLVIGYSYLWAAERARGQEEGVKDRPCAIVLTVADRAARQRVTVLPITHTPPEHPLLAVEIPARVKLRLSLDEQRSWIMLTEANRFTWPGPDIRPRRPGVAESAAYGLLPYTLFEDVRVRFIEALRDGAAGVVPRTG